MPSLNRPSAAFSFALGVLLVLLVPLSPLAAQPSQAQDDQPDRQEKARHYSLYRENFKNDEFKKARKDLQWIIQYAPGFPKGDDRNYRRYVKTYQGLAEQAANDENQTAYLDTAATVLHSATDSMDAHGLQYDEYAWEIRKGRFLEQYGDLVEGELPDGFESAHAHYRTAFSLAPGEIDPYYIQQAVKGYLEANQQSEALAFLNEVEEKRADDEEVQKIVSSTRQDVFGKNPQAQITYLEEQLEKNPESQDVMVSLFDAYVNQGNISKASELAPRLMKKSPPAETVREIADMRLEDGRPGDALSAYERAVEQGAELKAEDHYNRGVAHQQQNNFSKARSAFEKALELDPEFGRAHIAIGDLYARAVSECSGSELGRGDKAVYWAAVDQYKKAIQIDSSLESVAESKIQSYRDVFPTQEDIFYRDDWSKGESFTINSGCYSWINETTTVRQAP